MGSKTEFLYPTPMSLAHMKEAAFDFVYVKHRFYSFDGCCLKISPE